MKFKLENNMSVADYTTRENAYKVLETLSKEELIERHVTRTNSLLTMWLFVAVLMFFVGIWVGM